MFQIATNRDAISLENVFESASSEGDDCADQAAADMNKSELGRCWPILRKWRKNSEPVPTDLPPRLAEFLEESSQLPSWIDFAKLQEAHRLYSRYPADILAMLLYAALPECYAAPDGASVLQRTNKMATSPGPRLLETARFVVEVMSADSLMPGGVGIRSIQKVRWMHAVLRQEIRSNGKSDLTKEVPLNQEHLSGTLLAFSQISIDALGKMGVCISESEQAAYLHRWVVIGHLLGIKDEYLPRSVAEARSLATIIRQRNHRSSEVGKQLTAELMGFTQSRFPPFARSMPTAMVRYLVGERTADLLDIPKAGRSRHFISMVRWGFLMRSRVNSVLPVTRVLDLYNRLIFVKTVLWIETRLNRN